MAEPPTDPTLMERILLSEIKQNRKEIHKVYEKLDSKVGRVELFGWLGVVTALTTVMLSGLAFVVVL